jgi:hypothetical protein
VQIEDFKVIAVLVCDDVRREINGKEILIGVYSGGSILLQYFPTMINPVFWCQFIPMRPGKISTSFRLTNESGVEFYQFGGELTAGAAREPGSVAISGQPIQAHSEMRLVLQMKVGGSEWTTIQEVAIRKGSFKTS